MLKCNAQIIFPETEYYQKMSSLAQIRPQEAEIESIIWRCLKVHCRTKFFGADLRFGFLRLSTIKKCPHMHTFNHRELRNSKVQLMWWWVGGWYERIFETGRLRRPCQLLMPSLSDGSQGEDKVLSMKYFFFRSEITVVSMGSPRFPWTPPATTS